MAPYTIASIGSFNASNFTQINSNFFTQPNNNFFLCEYADSCFEHFENPAQIQHKPAQTSTNHVKISCEFCGKIFKTQDNLTRHLKKFCKLRKDKENELEEIKVLLEEEREMHKQEKQRLYDCIDRLIEKAGNTTKK